jgi:predicted metal-dependent phosphoesterase TrpH
MNASRLVGILLWVGGLVLGTVTDTTPERPALYRNGYRVLAGDFHVHGFLGDGVLPPWDLIREARRRGLDVIALTNHNQMLAMRIAERMPRKVRDVLLLPGEELTAPGFHLAVVGIARAVDWTQPVVAVVDAVHKQGGVAIAAHPVGGYGKAFDDAALAVLDGVEAAHPLLHVTEKGYWDLTGFYQRAASRHPHLAAIGSSDFHHMAPLGLCRTYLLARELSADAVIEAIRQGRTVACDAEGRSYGAPQLVHLMAEDCRRSAIAGSARGRIRSRLPMVMAWTGLLILVLLGPRDR